MAVDAAAGFWGLALRYLKAPATLVGGAVSQVLYPRLAGSDAATSLRVVRQVMLVLALAVAPLVMALMLFVWLIVGGGAINLAIHSLMA